MYLRNEIYWLRVWTPFGATRRVSLETRHEPTARLCAAWVADVRARLDRHRVLDAIVSGDITLPHAYVLGETDAAAWLTAQRADAADHTLTDADLSAWSRWVIAGGTSADTAANYQRQVTACWPAPRRVSWLTARQITLALDALPLTEPTKNRHKSAFGSLCKFLVRQGLLDHTPLPSVSTYRQSTPRDVWYTTPDALKVLHALPEQQRAMEATMWACGWELGACKRATVADFDLSRMTALARGTKTRSRHRMTIITEYDAVAMIAPALREKAPDALVWPHLVSASLLPVHEGACAAVQVPRSTLHDWRHTFAVREIKKGRPLTFIAQMLGHRDTTMLQQIYGRHTLSTHEIQAYAGSPQPADTI